MALLPLTRLLKQSIWMLNIHDDGNAVDLTRDFDTCKVSDSLNIIIETVAGMLFLSTYVSCVLPYRLGELYWPTDVHRDKPRESSQSNRNNFASPANGNGNGNGNVVDQTVAQTLPPSVPSTAEPLLHVTRSVHVLFLTNIGIAVIYWPVKKKKKHKRAQCQKQ